MQQYILPVLEFFEGESAGESNRESFRKDRAYYTYFGSEGLHECYGVA